ncbi:ABC transporter permease (plasmid) [Aminobacter sp. P9b]|uniref:ABC transporter permease n=1 Tax=Aminobacter TaxID=31988 RepID=UPI000D3CF9F5|nr:MULTISPECIES: ABC transporter permease [Aminobacter]AWC26054.1 beta-methylgalactoside transporter inner membrane component [Aminobacter sp. MSH1]CAI2936608.1 Beta-methylgalactoside transporter inner membrane component [Aminobacter niigataensis]
MDLIQNIFSSFVALVPVTLAQSLILAFVVLGIMIPFRTLNFPDLTSEGAFPLGGCVCGVLLAGGASPLTAIAVAVIAGFLAGCCTAFIHLRFRIHTLLAGILMMTMLYSINLRIMGKSNLSVFGSPSVFDWAPYLQPGFPASKIVIAGLIGAAVFILLNMFFKTEKGTAIRAVGANPDMAEAQGINVWVATIGGVGLASAFSATSGALMVQSQGFADVNMGLGILINGLAALMIGEAIVGKQTVLRQLAAPFVGAVVYYQLVSFCLAAGMPPPDLKLATGLFVLAMLALPSLKRSRGSAPARETIRE